MPRRAISLFAASDDVKRRLCARSYHAPRAMRCCALRSVSLGFCCFFRFAAAADYADAARDAADFCYFAAAGLSH